MSKVNSLIEILANKFCSDCVFFLSCKIDEKLPCENYVDINEDIRILKERLSIAAGIPKEYLM